MVKHAIAMEEGEEKDALIYGIAYAMKRNYLKFNKDTVADSTILADLDEMAEGKFKTEGIELPHTKSFNISPAERNTAAVRKKGNNNNKKKKRRF
jgi:hypothetical protein